ncbi:MAG: DNA-protecting protein DprA [Chthonomonadaceae bacterium]|nr:DNA-protecting protein DprA [Chthonomonadaceae bacterium]
MLAAAPVEASEKVERAAAKLAKIDLALCQRLLMTEAPTHRVGAFLQVLNETGREDWSGFTDSEVERAKLADPDRPGRCSAELFIDKSTGRLCFVRGELDALTRVIVGVVGTRTATTYGLSVTKHFSSIFAAHGCSVLSGGAIGIDAAAHLEAIEAGGKTIVAVPCGVDVVYPPRHKILFEKSMTSGCLVSPFACGAPMETRRLLARNHFLAGLCDALVVIEAPEGSGSLITATAAIEQGKPVFVAPGPLFQSSFVGSHNLIRTGAQLVSDPRQVLEFLGVAVNGTGHQESLTEGSAEAIVFDCLDGMPKSAEALGLATSLSVNEVLTALTFLELDDRVLKSPEGYSRKR